MSPDHRGYYMSDHSYERLVLLAKQHGYVKWNAKRYLGLSEFLNDLAVYPLQDTRPPLVQRRHKEEISLNRAPTWMNFRQRRLRLLKLSDSTIQSYFEAAYAFGIIQAEPFAIGGPRRETPLPSVSFVLEAIGLRWLTPSEFPYKKG